MDWDDIVVLRANHERLLAAVGRMNDALILADSTGYTYQGASCDCAGCQRVRAVREAVAACQRQEVTP